jgi:hypothetical protein
MKVYSAWIPELYQNINCGTCRMKKILRFVEPLYVRIMDILNACSFCDYLASVPMLVHWNGNSALRM